MFKWRLYYEDGTTFSDTDGEPHESPAWGCVGLAQPDLKGSDQIMINSDYLMWRSDLNIWTQCGRDGIDDHLAHFVHSIQCIRKTRWIPTLDFRVIWKRVRHDCGIKE